MMYFVSTAVMNKDECAVCFMKNVAVHFIDVKTFFTVFILVTFLRFLTFFNVFFIFRSFLK